MLRFALTNAAKLCDKVYAVLEKNCPTMQLQAGATGTGTRYWYLPVKSTLVWVDSRRADTNQNRNRHPTALFQVQAKILDWLRRLCLHWRVPVMELQRMPLECLHMFFGKSQGKLARCSFHMHICRTVEGAPVPITALERGYTWSDSRGSPVPSSAIGKLEVEYYAGVVFSCLLMHRDTA
jgi:hypothetical protein